MNGNRKDSDIWIRTPQGKLDKTKYSTGADGFLVDGEGKRWNLRGKFSVPEIPKWVQDPTNMLE